MVKSKKRCRLSSLAKKFKKSMKRKGGKGKGKVIMAKKLLSDKFMVKRRRLF